MSGKRKIETFLPAKTNLMSEHDVSLSVDSREESRKEEENEGNTCRRVSELIDIIASPRDVEQPRFCKPYDFQLDEVPLRPP